MLNFFRNKKNDISILDDERYRPKYIDEKFEIEDSNKINYLRISYSIYSKIALLLSLFALLLSYISIRLVIYYKGNPRLYISAIIFSSLIFDIYSLYYIYKDFKNNSNKKQLLKYLSLLLSGIQLIFWVIIIIVGA